MDLTDPGLFRTPELLPFAIDPPTDRVEFRTLTPVDYEKASFLDGRVTAPVAGVLPYAELVRTASHLPLGVDFIFHIGHAGSTLLSRLLGQHPTVFSLREPLALRAFAQAELLAGPWSPADLDARLTTFLAFYSRTWRPEQRTVVKATSSVSELADRLLGLAPGARGLMMILQPEPYLATILGGPNSRLELSGAAAGRSARLRRRLPGTSLRLEGISVGEQAAMSWTCEMAGLAAAAAAHGDRVRWLDFDAFLARPPDGLREALRFFRGDAAAADAAGLAQSPYLERYSKAPEYAYGPEVRAQTLAAARAERAEEIAQGLRWIEAARHEPRLAQVFDAADLVAACA